MRPLYTAVCGIKADKVTWVAGAVDVSSAVDGGAEVRWDGFAGPLDLCLGLAYLDQSAPDSVTTRDVHAVTYGDRYRGVNVVAGLPRNVPQVLSAACIIAVQTRCAEDQILRDAANLGLHRGRVTWRVVAALPDYLAGFLVKGYDRGRWPSGADYELVAVHERGLRIVPSGLSATEVIDDVSPPDRLAGLGVDAKEYALSADRVYIAAADSRCRFCKAIVGP